MGRADDASGSEDVNGAGQDGSRDDADEWGELEIEVSDLRTGMTVERTTSRIPARRSLSRTAPGDAFDGEGDQEGNVYHDTADAGQKMSAPERMARRRQRGVRGALVVVIVALALLGLLASNPGLSGAVRGDLFPPTPTIAPGSNVIWFRHSVPWGRVAIDGHIAQVTNEYTPATLTPGRHTLTYQAPPFTPLRCTVSAPAAPPDTCPQDLNIQNEPDPPPGGERAIDLRATPDMLPAASRAALLAAIQRELDTLTSTAQVMPGDHYGTPDGKVLTATQPMTMTLAFVAQPANPSGSSMDINGESCNPLCVIPGGPADTLIGWPLYVIVIPQWRYAGDGGTAQVVTVPAPNTGQAGGGFTGNLLTFSVQWAKGDWQMSLADLTSQEQMATLACDAAMQAPPPMNSANGGLSYRPGGVATQQADGCTIAVTPLNANSTPAGKPALLLLRFGALLAANGEARKLYPTLPVANAREAALAGQIGSGGQS